MAVPRPLAGVRAIVCIAGVLAAVSSGAIAQSGDAAARQIDERLRELKREADELASREKTLLEELRHLELQRQITNEELAALATTLREAEQQVADAEARTQQLQQAAVTARPELEQRLVRLYKMGRGGYWRLLLEAEDLRTLARTYRMAAALTQLERERVRTHHETLESLQRERAELDRRLLDARALRARTAAARAELDRAITARTALLTSIERRRDLGAQLARELQAAQARLEGIASLPSPVTGRNPIRPLKGGLPWPADGIVIGRFGQPVMGVGGARLPARGIEISLPEGHRVSAIHDGVVSFSGPLTGFGSVVVVDHGDNVQSLYGYLSRAVVNKGDRVDGMVQLGASGRNTAGNPSLYFELRIDGQPVDPLQWLRRQS